MDLNERGKKKLRLRVRSDPQPNLSGLKGDAAPYARGLQTADCSLQARTVHAVLYLSSSSGRGEGRVAVEMCMIDQAPMIHPSHSTKEGI